MAKEKQTKLNERKRKFQKYQKEKIVPKKVIKTRDSVKEFTGICMSDSEDDITQNKNLQINSQEINSSPTIDNNSIEGEKFANEISHITDSEDEGPEEKPIQRRLSIKNEDELKKEENIKEKNNLEKEKSAIQNIAMNYFSAYMSDSEEETISENQETSNNSKLQIPDYNVLVKMNN